MDVSLPHNQHPHLAIETSNHFIFAAVIPETNDA